MISATFTYPAPQDGREDRREAALEHVFNRMSGVRAMLTAEGNLEISVLPPFGEDRLENMLPVIQQFAPDAARVP